MKVFLCHYSYENAFHTLTTRDFVVVERDKKAALGLLAGANKFEEKYWTIKEIDLETSKAYWIAMSSSVPRDDGDTD
jgi:hypothetical protein